MIQATNGRECVLRLVDGEDLVGSLRGLSCPWAVIASGIGMVRNLRLGYWNGRTYEESRIDEPAELVSLQGTLARSPQGPFLHCHIAVAARDGVLRGGHLLGATVMNTAEITLLLVPGIRLDRAAEKNGLTALVPSAEEGAGT